MSTAGSAGHKASAIAEYHHGKSTRELTFRTHREHHGIVATACMLVIVKNVVFQRHAVTQSKPGKPLGLCGRSPASADPKYVDKAHRRGKVGWNVGKRMEVVLHYRRPHMALVWTGRGRAVPKVVPRRGSVVHRDKLEKVPRGFGGR